MRYRLSVFVSLLVVGLLAALPAQAQQAAGKVERKKGVASRTAAAGTFDLALGTRVYVGDEISTGPGARLQIRFADESILTLGESARITIDQLIYSPGGESD